MNYGIKLREIRKNMGLTLEDVSKKTKFTKSFISQIENGKNSPSIASLKKICASLNTTISELFENERSAVHVLKKSDYTVVEHDGSIFSFMATQFSGRKLEPLLIEISPHGEVSSKSYQMKGEKFAYLIKGQVEFLISDEVYILKEGDLIYFTLNIPYKFKNITGEKVVLLCVGMSSIF